MKIKAFAKVNLCLKVYKGLCETKHNIDSIMMIYKKIHDDIFIKKSNELYISYKEKNRDIYIPDCLVSKALNYLHCKYDFDMNYNIKIVKKIPFGSGLGGGSADAAAVINYVLQHNKPVQLDLKEIAIELGSDIPFFLSNLKLARVKHLGDYVTPIYNWKPKIELHFSPIACETNKIFELLEADQQYISKVNVDHIIQSHLYKQHYQNVVYNDLTKYIIQNYKELQDIYKSQPHKSFFTGSGSTIVTLKD